MGDAGSRPIYLLNSPVLTGYGRWKFEGPISVEQAAGLLKGGFISAIGHPGAAEFLSRLLGIEVPVNRIMAQMEPGDRAVVLRLKQRLPEGKVLSVEEMEGFPFELGLLTRLADHDD